MRKGTIGAWLSLALLAAGCSRIEEISATNGSTVEIRKGTQFSIARGTSPTVSPEYKYSWETPTVNGSAVVYEGPGESRRQSTMPGSSGELVFVFRAAEAGEADILIKLRAGSKVENREDYRLHVRVR